MYAKSGKNKKHPVYFINNLSQKQVIDIHQLKFKYTF